MRFCERGIIDVFVRELPFLGAAILGGLPIQQNMTHAGTMPLRYMINGQASCLLPFTGILRTYSSYNVLTSQTVHSPYLFQRVSPPRI